MNIFLLFAAYIASFHLNVQECGFGHNCVHALSTLSTIPPSVGLGQFHGHFNGHRARHVPAMTKQQWWNRNKRSPIFHSNFSPVFMSSMQSSTTSDVEQKESDTDAAMAVKDSTIGLVELPQVVTQPQIGQAETRRKKTLDSIPRYFNVTSSVRSTSQTDAIGRRPTRTKPKSAEQSSTSNQDAQKFHPQNEEAQQPDQNFFQSLATLAETIPPTILQPFTLLLLSQFILFLGVGAVIPTLPLYTQSIGLSSTFNGVVLSAPALALLLSSRMAGEYADGSRKKAMMGGMAVIALADIGTALSTGITSLVMARLALGLGRGYAEAGERGMLTDLANTTPELRGRALALQQAVVGLGIAMGAPLGGWVVEEFGVRSSFLCVSVAAVGALVVYGVLPETVGGALLQNDNGVGEEEVDPTNGAKKAMERETAVLSDDDGAIMTDNGDKGADWVHLLTTSPTWRSLALSQSGTSFGYACKIAIVPLLAATYLPGGAAGAGFLLSAAGLAGLVGAPLGGYLSDVLGSRVAAGIMGLVSGVALGLVPVGLSLGATGDNVVGGVGVDHSSTSGAWDSILNGVGGPEGAAFSLLILLWSVGASAQGPALTSLAQEKAPLGSEATALGLPRAAGDGTYIVAPLVLGYVSDAVGKMVPGAACGVAGGAICLGSMALFLLASSDDDKDKN